MNDVTKHILVTGSHRSGTTWVGKTISRHPGIYYINEPFNVDSPNRRIGLKLNNWFTYSPTSSQINDIKLSFDNLLNSNPIHRALWMSKNTGWDIKTPLRIGKHLLLNSFHQERILVKDPIALLSAGWLHEMYGFKIICMVRNPLAFVGSLKKASWDFDFRHLKNQEGLMRSLLSPFIDEINMRCFNIGDFIDRSCSLWNILHYVILDYQKRYPSWLFQRYEDLAMDPVSEFKKIFCYLEIDMDESIVDYIQKYTSDRNPLESSSAAYRPINSKDSLCNWRKRLSEQDIARVKIATRNIASRFYEDSD